MAKTRTCQGTISETIGLGTNHVLMLVGMQLVEHSTLLYRYFIINSAWLLSIQLTLAFTKQPSRVCICTGSLKSEKETEISRCQSSHSRIIGRQRRINHSRFLLLELNNPALNRIFDDELDGFDRPALTQPMDSIHRLVFNCRVPPAIHEVYTGRLR